MPHLSGITIYPVKSLDGLALSEAMVLPSGALMHDRRWRLVDGEGAVVNAKKNTCFHGIRATFEIEGVEGSSTDSKEGGNFVTLSVDGRVPSSAPSALTEETFQILPGSEGPCGWLSEALAIDVFLQERFDGGFPDDREAAGATLISTETLYEVARWFNWDREEARRRLRMNLQISGRGEGELPWSPGPFWEDVIHSPLMNVRVDRYGDELIDAYKDLPASEPHAFQIGVVPFFSKGHCRRCVVPSRDTQTGSVTSHFRDVFEMRRTKGFRPDVDTRLWGSAFRCGLNTSVCLCSPEQIAVGDSLRLSRYKNTGD